MTSSRADREAAIRRTYNARVDRIRAHTGLSGAGRRARLAQAKLDADQQLADLDSEADAEFTRDRNQLVQRLFGNPHRDQPGSGADYHRAMLEAEQISDPHKAIDALRLARLAGHTTLERAIGAAAEAKARTPFSSSRWQPVLDEWAADDPDTTTDLEQLRAVDTVTPRQQIRDRIFRQMRAPADPEIQGQDLGNLAARTDQQED
jgi:hypothetical protein